MPIRTYVEFLLPGTMFSEAETRPLPYRGAPITNVPARCFGYRVFDRREVEEGGETLVGKPHNYSPTTYFGREYSVADLVRDMPHERVLISNIRDNGYHRAVRTRLGNWQPLRDGDLVVPG